MEWVNFNSRSRGLSSPVKMAIGICLVVSAMKPPWKIVNNFIDNKITNFLAFPDDFVKPEKHPPPETPEFPQNPHDESLRGYSILAVNAVRG